MLLDSLQTIHGAHREPTHHTHTVLVSNRVLTLCWVYLNTYLLARICRYQTVTSYGQKRLFLLNLYRLLG